MGNHSLFGNGVPLSHLTGPAFLCCRSEAFVHGASPFFFCRSGNQQYSGSAWHGWSLAMLCLEGAGTVFRSLRPPCHVTSQLPFSSPAEALLGAGRSPGWARERFRRIKLLGKR